ncbi:hypothetical protein G3I60_28660 [Streptomyces sp. SID13666]|uniref:hypothetical protein n=1 Tax=unclassified Streptomyces TaxID=2593676 RepID=UPI0013C0FF5A|nr:MULTISPECIES: hypothetical protein [unclassified Streptomyces]NEA58024.1 hypothetical protein [Streptomyces sp. SID13666]NEA72883.1 hypothetical protein [Streptomyces sp. SID13588]
MSHQQLPTTQAAVTAVREIARQENLEIRVTDDIGADRSARRSGAGAFSVADPDGSLPHEAYVELGGSPAVEIELYSEGDAKIIVDGVEFHDVPRDSVPAFLDSVYRGLVRVKTRFLQRWLIVSLPGDETYRELVPGTNFSPWLGRQVGR